MLRRGLKERHQNANDEWTAGKLEVIGGLSTTTIDDDHSSEKDASMSQCAAHRRTTRHSTRLSQLVGMSPIRATNLAPSDQGVSSRRPPQRQTSASSASMRTSTDMDEEVENMDDHQDDDDDDEEARESRGQLISKESQGRLEMISEHDVDEQDLSQAFEKSMQIINRDNTTMAATLQQDTAAGRNASIFKNVSQIVNDSEFGDEHYYLRGFTGDSELEQLLHVVGQEKVRGWREQLPKDTFKNVHKLGEGTYGEVFATTMNGKPVAMKIIPFKDDVVVYDGLVNNESLKSAGQIIPEILITRELSSLDNEMADFSASNFVRLVECHVVRGCYPEELLREWDAYDARKGSENDRPSDYSCDQSLFICIGLALGGVDVESYKVRSEKESLSLLFQLALALVVAEKKLEFEHRDLHIGNALVDKVGAKDEIGYRLFDRNMYLKSHGVKLSVIDFTNSRLKKKASTIYLDLELDPEIFQGQGDYQFEIYRLMRQHNGGNWKSFAPMSNVYWLHYMAKELILEERKKGKAKGFTKRRRLELMKLFDALPSFDEVAAFLHSADVYELFQEYVRFEDQQ